MDSSTPRMVLMLSIDIVSPPSQLIVSDGCLPVRPAVTGCQKFHILICLLYHDLNRVTRILCHVFWNFYILYKEIPGLVTVLTIRFLYKISLFPHFCRRSNSLFPTKKRTGGKSPLSNYAAPVFPVSLVLSGYRSYWADRSPRGACPTTSRTAASSVREGR